MWFIFGFITLISFSVYLAYKRINAAWKGVPGITRKIPYQSKIARHKQQITGVLIGIEGHPKYDYSFKRETWLDRLFRALGISAEHQTGNKDFDELVYIVSDNSHLHNLISFSTTIRDSVLRIFEAAEKHECNIKEIRNNTGRLWIKCKVNRHFREASLPQLAAAIVPFLNSINIELNRVPPVSVSTWKDPFVIKAAIILAVSSGLAINGFVHLLRIAWTNVPFTVDSSQLLTASIYWGLGIVVSLLLITIFLLGRSARTHLVMIELVLIGSFGATATSFAELRDLNMELDVSPGAEHHVKTHNKKIRRSRRSTSYYLYLDDWNQAMSVRKVKVSSNLYHKVHIGNFVTVIQKPGYLNYRWVDNIELKP